MKEKVAMAFGSFDILHPGHIHYLKAASRHGRLIVVVSRDSSVKMLKGAAPLMGEKARLEIVGSLKFVDRAVLGNRIRRWNDIYRIVLRFRPDFIVFGYDQKVDRKYLDRFLSRNGIAPKIVIAKPFIEYRYKSSKLKRLLPTLR
jgi:FAD synthetase